MPSVDPLAVRVVRRHLAQVRAERLAREVQRRSEGLVTVRGEDEDRERDGSEAPAASRSRSDTAAGDQPTR